MKIRCSGFLLFGVAVLLLGASSCGSDSSNPSAHSPSQASPTFYAPGVPYVYDGKLFIAHRAQAGRWISAETGADYTAATRVDGETFAMVIFHDGKQVQTSPKLISGPKFSSDGSKLAWVVQTGDNAGSLVVRDLRPYRDLGELRITISRDAAEGISVPLAVHNDGTAYYKLAHKSWAWKPGGDPRRAAEPYEGPSPNPPGFGKIKRSISLSPDHLWGAWVTPDGHGINIQKPSMRASRFAIELPTDMGRGGPVQWESPTVALVFMSRPGEDGSQQMASCDVIARQCVAASK